MSGQQEMILIGLVVSPLMLSLAIAGYRESKARQKAEESLLGLRYSLLQPVMEQIRIGGWHQATMHDDVLVVRHWKGEFQLSVGDNGVFCSQWKWIDGETEHGSCGRVGLHQANEVARSVCMILVDKTENE